MISSETHALLPNGYDYYKDKNYINKTFEIKKNNRKHVVQISVEQGGIFKSLLDIEFINGLIWAIDSRQDYVEGIEFNSGMDAIHFIYNGDNSENDEIVILSIQTFI